MMRTKRTAVFFVLGAVALELAIACGAASHLAIEGQADTEEQLLCTHETDSRAANDECKNAVREKYARLMGVDASDAGIFSGARDRAFKNEGEASQ